MSKKIILCFDGTCNDPEDAIQSVQLLGLGGLEDDSISNILKLHLLFGGHLKPTPQASEQMSFYYSGVGTYGNWLQRLRNKVVAPEDEDVGTIIKRATQDLYHHHENGDELFIFGFSRGAAIARRFAAVIEKTFKSIDPARVIKVRFMGVFDTVAALNKPNFLNPSKKPASDVVFENNTIAGVIEEALHLVALDERRIAFQPTLMNKEDKVTELWFPGAHSDVGGGYHYDGLSDGALQFMIDELSQRGLGLSLQDPKAIDYDGLSDDKDIQIELMDVIIQPNHLGKNHQQQACNHIKQAFLGVRSVRVNIADMASMEPVTLHRSIVERIHDDPDYKPDALRKHNLTHPYTGESIPHKVLNCPGWEKSCLSEYQTSALRSLARLDVDESVTVTVFANQKYSRSGVLLVPGEKYFFTVDLGQQWFDSSIACTPEGWDRDNEDLGIIQSWLIKSKEDERRCPQANWFEVIGTTNKTDDHVFRVLEYAGSDNPYSPPVKGGLFLFANDLINYYGNNLGAISLTVTRHE
jgi:T6SS, Phospholipase effector Tle1-like, catalytic domain